MYLEPVHFSPVADRTRPSRSNLAGLDNRTPLPTVRGLAAGRPGGGQVEEAGGGGRWRRPG